MYYRIFFYTVILNGINSYSCICFSLTIVFITEVRTELSEYFKRFF